MYSAFYKLHHYHFPPLADLIFISEATGPNHTTTIGINGRTEMYYAPIWDTFQRKREPPAKK
jgi:hypothetical protein